MGRELDPRFYCSLRAVKVVSPAYLRRISQPAPPSSRQVAIVIVIAEQPVEGGWIEL